MSATAAANAVVVYQTKAFVGTGASVAQAVSVFLIGTTLATSGYLGYRELTGETSNKSMKNLGFLAVLTTYALSVPTLMYFIGVKPLVVRIVQQQQQAGASSKILLETTNFWGRRRMSPPLDFAQVAASASRFPGLVNVSSLETKERFFLPSIQGFKTPEFRAQFLAKMEKNYAYSDASVVSSATSSNKKKKMKN